MDFLLNKYFPTLELLLCTFGIQDLKHVPSSSLGFMTVKLKVFYRCLNN